MVKNWALGSVEKECNLPLFEWLLSGNLKGLSYRQKKLWWERCENMPLPNDKFTMLILPFTY